LLTIAGRHFESSLPISTPSIAVVHPSSLVYRFFPFLIIAQSPFLGVQRVDLCSPVAGHRFKPSFKHLFPAHRQLASNISAKHV
jgi:hypothetical protein